MCTFQQYELKFGMFIKSRVLNNTFGQNTASFACLILMFFIMLTKAVFYVLIYTYVCLIYVIFMGSQADRQ